MLKSSGQHEENKEQTEGENLDEFEDNQLLKGEREVKEEGERHMKVSNRFYAWAVYIILHILDKGFLHENSSFLPLMSIRSISEVQSCWKKGYKWQIRNFAYPEIKNRIYFVFVLINIKYSD